MTFILSVFLGFLYEQTVQKAVNRISDKLCPVLSQRLGKIEGYLLKIH